MGGLYEQVTTTRSGASSPEYRHHISAGTEVVAIQTYWDTAGDRVEYLHKDHVGSVTAISNEATITNIAYDAWGKRYDPADLPLLGNLVPGSFLSLDLTLTSLTRGFTSHEQLEHLGLVHMNARVYDPEIGRFLSPDPVVQDIYSTQTINRYSYVRNRPLSAVDPSGAIDLPFDTFFEFSWIEFVKWAATETMDHYVTKYLNEQQQKQLIKQSNYSQGIVQSIMNAAGIPGFGTLPNFSDIFELSPEDLILNIQSSGSGLGRGSGRDGDSGAAIGLRQLAGLLGRFHSGSDAAAKGDAGVSVSTDNPVSREVETGEGAERAQQERNDQMLDALRPFAVDGDIRGFWNTAKAFGDPLAELALDFHGSLYGDSAATRYAISKLELAFTGGDTRLSPNGLLQLKETVGIGLIRSHFRALQGDIRDNIGTPGVLSVEQIDSYHYDYFESIGLRSSAYGGRGVPGSLYCAKCDPVSN